eukprot:SAG22_NODE_581_length_8895_cov_2.587767_2_plen_185_part_00
MQTLSWTVHTKYIDSIRFFVLVLVVCHVLACSFFWLPSITHDCNWDGIAAVVVGNSSSTAAAEPDPGGCIAQTWRGVYELEELASGEQWMQSLYWAMTTMTTIGYGDYGPQTHDETIFVVLAEVIGLTFFVLLINTVSDLAEVVVHTSAEFHEIKNNVVGFLKARKARWVLDSTWLRVHMMWPI